MPKGLWVKGWDEGGSCAMLHDFNWWQWTRDRWSNFAFRATFVTTTKGKIKPKLKKKKKKNDASEGKVGNSSQPLSPRLCVSCLACIMFSDKDLQLGENF